MVINMKKCFSLLLAIILCFTFGGVALEANANQKTMVSPNWTNTTSVNTNLSFNGVKGICGAYVIGKAGTTQITGTVVLARKNSNGTYTAIKTWSGLQATGSMLTFDETYYVATGYTYRLTMTTTVYLNGIGETVSSYFEAYAS